jgi:hypothetical protein
VVDDIGKELVKSKKPIKLKTSAKPKTTRQRPTRRTQSVSHTPSVSTNLHEQIATRAYQNYERRIRQGPLDDWLQAEQEILGQRNRRHADMPHRGGYGNEEQE